jgi:DNA-binding XRE family transcriptional regulator
MDNNPIRKPRDSSLTPEQKARVEAIRAQNRTPEARAAEAQVREVRDYEYRETGTIATTGDGTTMWDQQVAFRRFVMGLRRERERLGLSLTDVAERAKIDKATLCRLETGQQLNPTVNTLARYAQALGKSVSYGLEEQPTDPSGDPLGP